MPRFESEPNIYSSEESHEEKELTPFETWSQKGIDEALEKVKERFEDDEGREDKDKNLDFHNTRHTSSIVTRVERILSAMKGAGVAIDERTIARGKMYGAFHDVVQEENEPKVISEGDNDRVQRVRRTGDNEKASWEAAAAFMEKTNGEAGEEVFTREDIDGAREAIEATVPSFYFDKEKGWGTVIQPNLNKKSSFEARALALADIGAAGMEGYEVYGPEGDAVFREENLDILRVLRQPEALGEEQKEYFKSRMTKWSAMQIGFAEGRKALLDKELDGLDPLVQEKLKEEVFSKFDDSIEGAKTKLEERKNMSFEELAKSMGYKR